MVRRSRLVIFYFKEKFCDSHASAIDMRSHLRDVYFQSVRNLVEKIISPVIFDTNCSFKQYNALSLAI